jgi:hypothetical protein
MAGRNPGHNCREAQMTNEIEKFEQFYSQAMVRIEEANTTDDVIKIHTQARALADAARALKKRDIESKATQLKKISLRKLGMLMAAQRDAGMMKEGRPKRDNEYPVLGNVGIDKNLAIAARKAYPEGWPVKVKKAPFRKATPAELEEHGHPPKSERLINPETGETISKIEGLKRKAAEEAVAAVEPLLSASDFSMSMQQKYEMWQRQQLKRMEEEFEFRVRAECQRRLEETMLPYYNEKHAEHERVVRTRKGMMTRANYNSIRSCLHPDRVQDPGLKKRYEEAFRIFNELELLFLDEKERPTASPFKMPTTVAEMMAMRKHPLRQHA